MHVTLRHENANGAELELVMPRICGIALTQMSRVAQVNGGHAGP